MNIQSEQEQIRAGRKRFISMAGAYFLGVFNDNFFKQAVCLLTLAAGMKSGQGLVIALFTAPFMIFAAPAGWLADRYPKRNVVIGAKMGELLAALIGAVGILSQNWTLTLCMVLIMGLQAAVFSPALNGAIPELYPNSYVPKANGTLRLLVSGAILSGTACAGLALDSTLPFSLPSGLHSGTVVVALMILFTAMVGLIVSLGTFSRPAADPSRPFPWTGPWATVQQLHQIASDPPLRYALIADVFIWSAGALQLLLLNPLGINQFKLGNAMTSGLIATQLVGIGVGGFLGGHLAHGTRWHRILFPSGVLMSLGMMAFGAVPLLPPALAIPGLFILVGVVGVAGGLFLIPTESFIQIRPEADRKGLVLASANFAVFAGITLTALLNIPMTQYLVPTIGMGITGVASLIFCLLIILRFDWRTSP